MKPDIAAPGVATLAAFAPNPKAGTLISFPARRWPPRMWPARRRCTWARSDGVTHGRQVRHDDHLDRTKNADDSVSRDYHAQGAGNIRPDRMFNPGVIFDSGDQDWLGFIAGLATTSGPGGGGRPSDYNSASIAIGKLVGSQTVTRRVTAVKAGLYQATINLPGVNATVSPSILYFSSAGQTKTIKIKFSRKNAPLSRRPSGRSTFAARDTQARLPIAVTPEALDAPDVITGTGASGSTAYQIKPGFSGPFPVTVRTGRRHRAGLGLGQRSPDGEPDQYLTECPPGPRWPGSTSPPMMPPPTST